MQIFCQRFSLIQILWTFIGFAFTRGACPPPHTIHPCHCLASRSVVVCDEVNNDEELIKIMKESRKVKIIGVELHSVSLRFIPEKAFDGTKIKFLEISNSSILALSDSERAFRGLEKSLISLKVANCTYASDWDWTQMERLKKLEELAITDSNLIEITEEFMKISKLPLMNIDFRSNNIMDIPSNAFATFSELQRLALDANSLEYVMRSMLPLPAKKLNSLGISHNKIEELPEDMFVGMPALKYLFLGGNPIQILDAPTFLPIWNQLRIAFFDDAPLRCDCRISWIAKTKQALRLSHGTCSTPAKLKGRKITELMEDELWC